MSIIRRISSLIKSNALSPVSSHNVLAPNLRYCNDNNRNCDNSAHYSFLPFRITAFAMLFSSLIIGAASYTSVVYATTASGENQNVGVGVGSSTVSISAASSVSFEVIPSSNGSLGVGKASLSISTNSNNGYKLYVSGPADPNDSNHYTSLYYDGDSSNTTTKIYGLPSSTTPISFTDTSPYSGNVSSTYNHWGFAVPSDTSTNSYATASAYDAVISSGTTIDSTTINNLTWKGISANYTKVKESGSSGTDNFDVYFGAYVKNNLMAGTYKNTIVYTAFVEGSGNATVTPTAIATGDTMTITLDYQGESINANQISLRLYDKDTDTTMGTCDNISIVSGTGTSNLLKLTCTATKDASASYGTKYDLLATISGVSGPSSTLTYEADNIFQFYTPMVDNANMQDMTAKSCQDATSWDSANDAATTYTLKDSRTQSTYLVAKLADGNCWMTQNLYFPADQTFTLTSSDSDVSDDYTLPASSITWGNSNSDTTGWFYAGSHSSAGEDSSYSGNNTGSYFSYVVATAGYAPSNSSGTAPNSVCPKGWKLPTGGSGGQFQAAYDAYGSYDTFKSAFKAAYTSVCFSSDCPSSNDVAAWWQSTIYSADYGCYMHMSSSMFTPQDYSNKYDGFSVRCVLSSTGS